MKRKGKRQNHPHTGASETCMNNSMLFSSPFFLFNVFLEMKQTNFIIGFFFICLSFDHHAICETFLKGIFHPFIPAGFSSFRNG